MKPTQHFVATTENMRTLMFKKCWVAYLFLVRPMKTMLPLRFIAIIFSTILLSSGCQKKTAATNPNSQSNTELHEITKPLQAADLVGYDGTKLRKSVGGIKEINEKHNRELEKMAETEQDPQQGLTRRSSQTLAAMRRFPETG